MKIKIAVLLATYNGASYVREQIQSIFLQSYDAEKYQLEIFISDDSSTDDTVEIISDIMGGSAIPISIINTKKAGGACLNFKRLIMAVDADFYFFCDQDDFWLPNKINIFMSRFDYVSTQQPCLIYSDLCIVDSMLFPMSSSMIKYQNLRASTKVKHLSVQNSVTGCASVINRALRDIYVKLDLKHEVMHDWSCAVIASLVGEVIYIDKPTILYRQHSSNVLGAKKYSIFTVLMSLVRFNLFLNAAKKSIVQSMKQSTEIYEALMEVGYPFSALNMHEFNSFKRYVFSCKQGVVSRLKSLFSGYVKHGIARNILYVYIYLFLI